MAEKQTLNALQALRGTAALLVVCNHAIEILHGKGGGAANPSLIAFANALGNLGVAVFFAISGFVMIYAHGNDFGVPGRPARFAWRRIGRILPIYWIVTLVYAAKLAADHMPPSIGAIVQSLLFIPFNNPDGGFGRPVLGQGWTLNYEAMFYLIFGLSLFLKRGLGLVFITFFALVGIGLTGAFGSKNLLAFWGSPVVLFFLAGVGLGLVRRRVQLPVGFYGALGIAIVVLGAAAGADSMLGSWPPGVYAVSAAAAVLAVAACVLATERPIAWFAQTMAKGIGDATYTIYLTHTLVISVVAKALAHRAHAPMEAFVAAMILLTTAVGVALYQLERLVRNRLKAPNSPSGKEKAVAAPAQA